MRRAWKVVVVIRLWGSYAVEDVYAAGSVTSEDGLAVGRDGTALQWGMGVKGRDGVASRDIPYLERLDLRGGDGEAPIRRQRHAGHRSGMAMEGMGGLPRAEVPHLERIILGGRDGETAIWRQRQGSNTRRKSVECADGLSGPEVPHPER